MKINKATFSVCLLLIFLSDVNCQKTVVIGTQVWMSQNLNVSKFKNGDIIPEAKTVKQWEAYASANEAAWCFYNFDSDNEKKFGKLFNWYAVNDVRGIANNGWHVPTKDEVDVLIESVGGILIAGVKLKNTTGWGNEGNGTNSSGFSGLPGGAYISMLNLFADIGTNGTWWTQTEIDLIHASRFMLNDYSNGIIVGGCSKYDGYSIRLIKD